MPTQAIKSKGVLLQRATGGSPDVFQTIAEVTSFNGPTKTLPTDDATNFDSTWEESIAGVPSGGEVTLGGNFIPGNAGQQGLEDDLENGTLRAFRIVYTDSASSKKEFSAYVTAFAASSGGPNNKVSFSATLKVSGAVT